MKPCGRNVIFVMGVTACGKTTVGRCLQELLPDARFLDAGRNSRWASRGRAVPRRADDYHSDDAKTKIRAGTPLTDGDREPWLERVRDAAVRLARETHPRDGSGSNVVVACSALKREYRDRLRALCDGNAVATWFVYLAAPREIIEVRLRQRKGHFADRPTILDSQFADLEPPEVGERAVVVDVATCSAQEAAANARRQLENGKNVDSAGARQPPAAGNSCPNGAPPWAKPRLEAS
ncbi:MAG: shikimate kinase [Olpidium bornovanus]|uniref:Gluconokinase n=1 Tax=Olpidium bornovanus TaxID=278681 RepID=A0A8H7ZU00_9FUNG|nr:MAG: shikimate kinase [Olpidium bornovanus]